jgi:ribonuclease HI
MVKIKLQGAGHLNLYYSPKKKRFRLTTQELKDTAFLTRINTCWPEPLAKPAAGSGVSAGPSGHNADDKKPPAATEYEAYVDGSFMAGLTGFGAVIIKNGEAVTTLSGTVPESMTGMRQVGGELQAVIATIEWCHANGIAAITICYDYKGIEEWATGGWRTNKAATRMYAEFMGQTDLAIVWRKVKAHSGNRWNDVADQLAKDAIIKHRR